MVRIGIIGTGQISHQYLVPAIREVDNAVFWSVLSRDKDRAEKFAKFHKAVSPNPSFFKLDKFLFDANLDAVIIATTVAL